MAKTLACANLITGCPQVITAETEDEVLTEAGRHASDDHGLDVTPELVELARANIREEADSVR
jgi:predicted small metal-binding protein